MQVVSESMKCLEDTTKRFEALGFNRNKAVELAAKMMELEIEFGESDFKPEPEPVSSAPKLRSVS